MQDQNHQASMRSNLPDKSNPRLMDSLKVQARRESVDKYPNNLPIQTVFSMYIVLESQPVIRIYLLSNPRTWNMTPSDTVRARVHQPRDKLYILLERFGHRPNHIDSFLI